MGFESLAATFGDVWPMLMSGLATTLQVTIISLVIAMFVGILVCLMLISRFKVLSGIASSISGSSAARRCSCRPSISTSLCRS